MRILGPTPPRLPVGYSDYVELRRSGFTYVDKTAFVAQVLASEVKVQLYPRPRRFGKTLNLSTVRYFVERGAHDLCDLFTDTELWNLEGGRHRTHFQRHPVIWLTFKDVKHHTWLGAWTSIRHLLQYEIGRLWTAHDLGTHFACNPLALERRAAFLGQQATADDLGEMLITLSRWCHEATGEPVAILIDEYDAALLTAWQHGYWNEAVDFFRSFLSSGLKDNPHLFRGALTGILRVAKEGIFSGLNNVGTFGLLTPGPASTAFGFTEDEVEALANGLGLHLPEIAAWYNGYQFGGTVPHTIYNPWSVIEYLNNPVAGFLPYWKNTSGNALIHDLLLRHAAEVGPQIECLLRGETVDLVVDESITLSDLERDPEAMWSLLLFSGYLTAERVTSSELGLTCAVRLPNREVASVYRTSFVAPLRRASGSNGMPALAAALLSGDAETAGLELERLMVGMLSHHDLGARPVEAVYQAFIVGLLVTIEATHRVVSNREAGHGRADVLITPRQAGTPGAVLELKVVNPRQTPEAALAAAVQQLRDRRYHTEVSAGGASTVHQYAVVFDGKRCWVEMVRVEV